MPRKRAVIKGSKTGWFSHVSPALQRQEYQQGVLFLDEGWNDVKNVHIWPTGTILKRNGCTIKMESPVRPGTSLPISYVVQYWTSDETSYLLMFAPKVTGSSAGCWEYAGRSSQTARGGSALSAWSGNADDRISGVTFNDCFIVTSENGSNRPCYFDPGGEKSHFLTLPPSAHSGRCVAAFKNYLFIGGVTEGNAEVYRPGRIRWSQVGEFTEDDNWPDSNYIDLDPDDGDRITAMAVLGDALVVFKEKKIYVVKYIGGPWVFDYIIAKVGVGCVAVNSLVLVDEKLVFLAEDGFYSFDGNNVTELSTNIKNKVIEISPDYRGHVSGAVYEAYDQVWFTMPYDGADTIAADSPMSSHPVNETWVYDYKRKGWSRYDLSLASIGSWYNEDDLTIGDLTQPWSTYDWAWNDRLGRSALSQLIGGDYQGHIHDLDTGSYDSEECKLASASPEASAIDGWVKTRWIDFGDPTITKRLYRTMFFTSPEGSSSYDLDVTFSLDWGISASAGSGAIDLGGDATIPMLEKRIDWTKQFRSIQLKFGTDGGGQPFDVNEIVLEYETKGRTGDPSYG